ncbi:class I SAM-dependent methyltransferase [Streptosporangium sandarakinum]|uniref:class I SAM-dependent methyltransferase n=1 Tax=Streptosporangium sandarakinum TaxID=1260955 RepID=UPI0036C5760B
MSRWNHNIHYHPVILTALPGGCGRVLDVGCGEGVLSRELRRVAAHVTAIDLDEPSIDLARRRDDGSGVEYVLGDFRTHPFEPASFDAVVSVATLHHMDAVPALRRMSDLLRPGGTLVVVGLARSRLPADLPWELAAAVGTRLYKLRRTYWEHSAPMIWPPPETYAGMRRIARETLPGARYRRHLLWRYSIVWRKPPEPAASIGR